MAGPDNAFGEGMKVKKTLWAFALVLGTGCLFPALSPASGPNGSLSLDGQLSRRVSGEIGHNSGMGGFLSLEFQPVQAFSIGVGADLVDFVGVDTPGQSFLESLNVVGRGIFNGGSAWQPYLTAGYGLNPKIDLQGDYTWWGDYHIMGGAGAWYFFDPQCALDMAVVYNYFETGADPLQTINVRLGFGYFFEPALNKYSVTREPVPASRRVSPASTHPAAQAPSASAPKAVASAPVTQTAAGALAALKAAQKSNAASTGVQQGSAIGPRGMASYREPAPTSRPQAEKQALGVPISKKEMGAPAPMSKAAQKKAEEELAEMEEELEEIPVETPVSKKEKGAAGKAPLGKLAFRESTAPTSSSKTQGPKAAEVSARGPDRRLRRPGALSPLGGRQQGGLETQAVRFATRHETLRSQGRHRGNGQKGAQGRLDRQVPVI
jgi:hypothetical protein